MRIRRRYALLGSFLLTAISMALGCGKGLTPTKVEGIVTLDGQPLSGATVSFMPVGQGGHVASGRTDADGSFRLGTFRTDDGALPGEYKVVVSVTEWNEKLSKDARTGTDEEKRAARMTMTPMGMKQAAQKKRKTPPAVPAIYSDVQQTPLKEVVPPAGKVELNLRSGAR